MEKVLAYPRDQVRQDTFYNCGPASAQTVIRAATGRLISEASLGSRMGTHTGGTDHIGLIRDVLRVDLPGGDYRVINIPGNAATTAQINRLWDDVRNSVDSEHGVVANIVAPPSNYPRAVAPSTVSPAYRGGTVYHYVAIMGYSDQHGQRAYWVADSGFAPYGYWCSAVQMAHLIANKGYTYAATPSRPNPHPTPVPDNQEARMSADIRQQLTGSTVPGEYPGYRTFRWQHAAKQDGPAFTLTDYGREIDREVNSLFDYRSAPDDDAVATLVGHVLAVRRQLDRVEDRLELLGK